MIKLKYGKSQPIHEGLIVEAEVSLGRWMATRRKENVRGLRESNLFRLGIFWEGVFREGTARHYIY